MQAEREGHLSKDVVRRAAIGELLRVIELLANVKGRGRSIAASILFLVKLRLCDLVTYRGDLAIPSVITTVWLNKVLAQDCKRRGRK